MITNTGLISDINSTAALTNPLENSAAEITGLSMCDLSQNLISRQEKKRWALWAMGPYHMGHGVLYGCAMGAYVGTVAHMVALWVPLEPMGGRGRGALGIWIHHESMDIPGASPVRPWATGGP